MNPKTLLAQWRTARMDSPKHPETKSAFESDFIQAKAALTKSKVNKSTLNKYNTLLNNYLTAWSKMTVSPTALALPASKYDPSGAPVKQVSTSKVSYDPSGAPVKQVSTSKVSLPKSIPVPIELVVGGAILGGLYLISRL